MVREGGVIPERRVIWAWAVIEIQDNGPRLCWREGSLAHVYELRSEALEGRKIIKALGRFEVRKVRILLPKLAT